MKRHIKTKRYYGVYYQTGGASPTTHRTLTGAIRACNGLRARARKSGDIQDIYIGAETWHGKSLVDWKLELNYTENQFVESRLK